MDVICAIRTRRSVRCYKSDSVDQYQIKQILEGAICAPSGKDKKPWKFRIITDGSVIYSLAQRTAYSRWLKTAPCCVAVFLDKERSYDYTKDVQSCGAAMQNILLAAHELGLGSCWVGELLSCQEEILHLLQISKEKYELMGIIAVGYTERKPTPKIGQGIEEFLI